MNADDDDDANVVAVQEIKCTNRPKTLNNYSYRSMWGGECLNLFVLLSSLSVYRIITCSLVKHTCTHTYTPKRARIEINTRNLLHAK